jgi:hypothetical protein
MAEAVGSALLKRLVIGDQRPGRYTAQRSEPCCLAPCALGPTANESSKKKGSSPNSGEGRPNLQEEVMVIAEAVGHPFDDFDLVVDALDQVGAQRVAAVTEDAG